MALQTMRTQFDCNAVNTYASMRRRLYMVGCVADASRIGIICSTVSVRHHAQIVQRLKVSGADS